jgi:hypothetical protein
MIVEVATKRKLPPDFSDTLADGDDAAAAR